MDTLLLGAVTVGFLVMMGFSIFLAYCLGVLTITILDYRWNRLGAPKKKE